MVHLLLLADIFGVKLDGTVERFMMSAQQQTGEGMSKLNVKKWSEITKPFKNSDY